MMRVVMDFPAAWAFTRATEMEQHDKECSYRSTGGAFLCDCGILWDEYERRAKESQS